jgi:hypothetical protein
MIVLNRRVLRFTEMTSTSTRMRPASGRARTLRPQHGRQRIGVVEITDGQERLIAKLSSTLMIVDERPSSEAKDRTR